MPQILKFPKNFLWGAATSAYQVEGGIENCDWAKVYPAGKACDHYHLYEEDFDLIKKLNQNAHRFSIEWSRIEPEEGKFDEKEIKHYRKVLQALKSRGIKTMVTLHHFTTPLWMAETGGWSNPKVIFYFSRFAKRVFAEYQNLVDFWITINEPTLYASIGYLEGRWAPFKKNPVLFLKVKKNQVKAHKELYNIFHKSGEPSTKVGINEQFAYYRPFNPNSFLDKFSSRIFYYFFNEFFLNRVKNHLDFIGLNYYCSERIKFPFLRKGEDVIIPKFGWGVYPQGIYHVLKELQKYHLPIYVVENGLPDAKDKLRAGYIKDHLYWIHKAVEEGIDVRGYFHWSLMDNFEWEKGFEVKFGLVEIDYKTLERKIRPSAYFYSKIAKENQLLL